ncbi:hypothetical protein JKA74_07905 [Marivirga sp. S37H4]|uniref:Uncharacterized protein n=2 Tax=Marivirga aurantiaca TaxID=2802615 RepID=A0A935C8H3_9BACT|nr:hypothetical protein [Marivirga aurantiaca]
MKTLETKISIAQNLMDGFAKRTGITKEVSGDPYRRYLWTDAFAVQSFFGLKQLTGEEKYHDYALKLIDEVHDKLGKYHPEDKRLGAISGLNEEEAIKHPTINGLRIGKRLKERTIDQPVDEQMEWERDGQYFHYNTRWANALFQAEAQTHDQKYANWAAELCLAGKKFINKTKENVQMHWKMSVDLSRPLVPSMGAHDPLEGLICLLTAKDKAPEVFTVYDETLGNFKILCSGTDWTTTDPLGLGGLLLNTIRVTELSQKMEVPDSIKPNVLLVNFNKGLEMYLQDYDPDSPASQRLAFRECGLSLGLRAIWGQKEDFKKWGTNIEPLRPYISLADETESFWSNSENLATDTWTSHLDINEVSLAASIIAKGVPECFGRLENP